MGSSGWADVIFSEGAARLIPPPRCLSFTRFGTALRLLAKLPCEVFLVANMNFPQI
jgi:hypothetical protein